MAGDTSYVVGEAAPGRGSSFGENRQDNVISIPAGTVARRFPDAKQAIFYARARPGQLPAARGEMEFLLRRLRRLAPGAENDFNLATAEQIISQIGLATFALAAVSLIIGGIGIAIVMVISVTERTREIGTRLAIGAKRRDVLSQFLIEASPLSAVGGVVGVGISGAIGFLLSVWAPACPSVPPAWAVGRPGLGRHNGTGVGISAGTSSGRPRSGRSAPLRVGSGDDEGRP